MITSKSSDWGGAFHNPIMKHHGTGSHAEHVIPMGISEGSEELAESYDENPDNDYVYGELTQLGKGGIPYLFRVAIAGGGSVTYEYIVNLNDTSEREYREAVRLYKIPSAELPSPGFYPDIYEAIALITADQLGVPRNRLTRENLPPYSKEIVAESVFEVYEEDELF